MKTLRFLSPLALVASLTACADASHSPPSTSSEPPAALAQRLLNYDLELAEDACPDTVGPTAHCGSATVPADWTRPDGDTLQIWYAVVPAASGHATRTILPFMGGPGEAISIVADRFLGALPLEPDQAMLFVDVRGSGRSSRVHCEAADGLTTFPYGAAQVDAFGACGEQLGARRDQLTTVATVLDIEAIRRALELPDPALIGISYGTWVAQVYTIMFPDVVQGTVLDGAFPLDLDPWGTVYPTSFAGVLERRCERSSTCDAGEESEQIRTLAAALAQEPVPIEGTDLMLTEGLFASMTQMVLGGGELEIYLAAVHAANGGDYSIMLELANMGLALPPPEPLGNSNALTMAVQCNDYSKVFDFADDLETRRDEYEARLAALPDDAFGWFSKQGWMDSSWEQGDSCLKWPVSHVPAEMRPPYDGPYPQVPVLIVNGDIDLNTPLDGAREVADLFPCSTLLAIENAGHAVIVQSECARNAEVEFLRTSKLPSADACAGEPVP